MSRISVIALSQLKPMQILETIDTEVILAARMARLKALWTENDPPAGAIYDVEGTEFDPLKINQEVGTWFELTVRDRVNQAARGVTLAFASGSDLDAIASRYPGGVPRLADETDDRYRRRIWLSPNLLSPHGTFEAYVFWALSADPHLRDATATTIPGTGNITVTVMDESASGIPTQAQLREVYEHITTSSRKGLTDVISIAAPKIIETRYCIRVWLYPGFDAPQLLDEINADLTKLIDNQRWLGFDHMRIAIDGVLARTGVYNAVIDEPARDVIVGPNWLVRVTSVVVTYVGRGE